MDEELEKVIYTWEHILAHDKEGRLSTNMREIIARTLVQLYALRLWKTQGGKPAADAPGGK